MGGGNFPLWSLCMNDHDKLYTSKNIILVFISDAAIARGSLKRRLLVLSPQSTLFCRARQVDETCHVCDIF